VHFDELNAQNQPKIVSPANLVVAALISIGWHEGRCRPSVSRL
jgi:hypothetical protein